MPLLDAIATGPENATRTPEQYVIMNVRDAKDRLEIRPAGGRAMCRRRRRPAPRARAATTRIGVRGSPTALTSCAWFWNDMVGSEPIYFSRLD